MIEAGGFTVAPCPHDLPCPLPEDDWCHFGVRLPRSKLHRRAKGVELGYEDEKFSYAVLSREPVAKAAARIIRQPQVRSGHVNLVTSEADGIHARTVSRKLGPLYKEAKSASWGEAIDLRTRATALTPSDARKPTITSRSSTAMRRSISSPASIGRR